LFTIATEIAALLAAAEFAEIFHEPEVAEYCRETADFWNENIEAWTYATDTALSRKYGVEGYYIRINPTDIPIDENKEVCINLRYQEGKRAYPAVDIISVDALALVRFGLRKPDDPHILDTLKLIDAELKVDTPNGPCWHRFTNDAYGEDDEGNPFNKSGKGRAWPLLTGERAHYEVAAGNIKGATKLLKAMDAFAYHGMLPEQIWDTRDIPGKELFFGKHTGSAMPLTWAHAEYLKLCHSIGHKRIFDMPEHTFTRYIVEKTKCNFSVWRFNMQTKKISCQKEFLRIEVLSPALIHFSSDNWSTTNEIETKTCGFDIHVADISIHNLPAGELIFTFFWKLSNKWEGKNFTVAIV
jgi:glucoamylase